MAGTTIGITTPLGGALKIASLSGHEGISQLFQFQLGLVAANSAHVPFEALIGQPVRVKLGSRYFSGIVQRFGEGGRGPSLTNYTAEVVPSVWLLTRKRQSRTFQNVSVPDILRQLFTGFPTDFRIKGTYVPRNYCVQYRETDFDFASRLMEEEGIFYFFEHASNGHRLVVTDSNDGFTPLSPPISYDPTGASRTDAGVIYAWEKDQELSSGLVTLRDYDFENPASNLQVQAQIQESVLAGKVTHHLHVAGNDKMEIYDYPGGYAKRFDGVDAATIVADGMRTAKVRMEEEESSFDVSAGANTQRLAAGYMFALQGHFDANGSWVVTSVDHSAHAKTPNGPVIYTNTFTSIPAALPFRPRRLTPKPSVQGVQTAVVVGPAGDEIYTDKYGRVKVQFHWDRKGTNDEKSSCWIRVAHPTVNPGTAPALIPPIGTEVVVAFEEGDPDQPIIVGTVDNTARQPPP